MSKEDQCIPTPDELPEKPSLQFHEEQQLGEARRQIIEILTRYGRQPQYQVNFTEWKMYSSLDGDRVPMSLYSSVREAIEAELEARGYEIVAWNQSITRYSPTDADVHPNTGVRFRPRDTR